MLTIPATVIVGGQAQADDVSNPVSVVDVNKLIASLETDSSIEKIEEAKKAYNSLTEEAKKLVKNYDILKELVDKEDARLVSEKINALTDESTPTAIKAASDAFTALSDDAKKLVSEEMHRLLKSYEKKMEEQVEQAKKEAQVLIDRIGRITNNYSEAQIKDVRLAYNKLSELARSYVKNVQKLIDAEAYILYQNTVVKEAKLQAAAFDESMEKLNKNSSTSEIAKARAHYNSLSYEAKKHVKMYEKLRRLETMWNDPDYLGLIFTYYPNYIHAIKPGGIEVQKPVYDPLYIPDDSSSPSTRPPGGTWAPYEEMVYANGRYTATLTSTQATNVADKQMMLKAGDIEVFIPTADVMETTAAIGVSMTTQNNQLAISFTKGQSAKVFSQVVEIRVPMRLLGGNASMAVQRIVNNGTTPVSYKVDGSNYVIRTKTDGTFVARTGKTAYKDLAVANASTEGIRAFANRGITYVTSGNAVTPNKLVTRADAATLFAKALDVSSKKATDYQDLGKAVAKNEVQGLLEAGIMSGITTRQFSPNVEMNRQDVAVMIANMYRYLNSDLSFAYNELQSSFKDVAALSYETRQSIAILEHFGIAQGGPSAEFKPEQKLTRAEFAEMLYKALDAINYL